MKSSGEPRSLRSSMIKGSFWMLASRWGIRGIGFISISILARLLTPEDFGIVAMSTIVMGLFEILFAFGLDLALIKNVDAGPDQYNTAWTIRLFQGITVGCLILASIPIAVSYFNEPRLKYVLPCLAFLSTIKGFTNIGVVNFRKDLNFEKEFKFLVVNKLIGFVITVTLSIIFRNFWALILGMIAGELVSVLQSYRMDRFRPRLSFKAVHEIWGFSQWMLIINIVNYANQRGTDIIVGGLTSKRELGLFSMASEVAMMPTAELITPISRALYSGYAKISNEPARLKAAYLHVLGFVIIAVTATGLGIFSTADEVVKLVLGTQWNMAIPVLKVIVFFWMVRISYSTIGNLFVILGHMKILASLQLAETLTTLSLAFWFVKGFGVIGAAQGMAISAGIFFFIYYAALIKLTLVKVSDIVGITLRPVLAGMSMIFVLNTLEGLSFVNEWIRLGIKVFLGAGIYTSVIYIAWILQKKPKGFEEIVFESVKNKSVLTLKSLRRKINIRRLFCTKSP